jgi:hypothetical protein
MLSAAYYDHILNAPYTKVYYIAVTFTNIKKKPISFPKKVKAKMLVQKSCCYNFHTKRSTGVNFTNILCAAFTYLSCVRSFFVLTFYVCTLLAQDCWHKS